jgi:hypothetical protein
MDRHIVENAFMNLRALARLINLRNIMGQQE